MRKAEYVYATHRSKVKHTELCLITNSLTHMSARERTHTNGAFNMWKHERYAKWKSFKMEHLINFHLFFFFFFILPPIPILYIYICLYNTNTCGVWLCITLFYASLASHFHRWDVSLTLSSHIEWLNDWVKQCMRFYNTYTHFAQLCM